MTDIYSPVGEEQIEGVSAAKLAEMIRANSNPNVRYFPAKEDVLAYLRSSVRPGDLVLTMGAGDIWKVADAFVKGAAAGPRGHSAIVRLAGCERQRDHGSCHRK